MSVFPLPHLCVHTFCKYLLSDSVSVSAQKPEFVRVVRPDPWMIMCKSSCLRVTNTWLAIRGGDGSVISGEQPLAPKAACEPHVALFLSKRTAEALMRRHFFSRNCLREREVHLCTTIRSLLYDFKQGCWKRIINNNQTASYRLEMRVWCFPSWAPLICVPSVCAHAQ